jgi:hypothetical protein
MQILAATDRPTAPILMRTGKSWLGRLNGRRCSVCIKQVWLGSGGWGEAVTEFQ